MEVKNQMVDQMLVNTVAQTPANQNAKAPKDADCPDFDSMVQKRSAEKDAPKTAKAAKAASKEDADVNAPAEEAPVTDEQYAIAAAMMFQAQPDVRVMPMQTEAVEAVPELVVDAAQTVDVEAAVELPETQIAQEIPVEVETEAAPEPAVEPETVETQPTQQPRQSQQTQKADVVAPRETETAVEAKPTEEKPELELHEQRQEQVSRTPEDDAPRTEEAPRFVRSEERTEPEDDVETDDAQAAAAAPLFDRVEAPVVKVAEASRPIPLEAEDGIEQLGDELGDVIVNSVDANRVEIQLTPENLGKLTVEITRGQDGTLSVVLHTENQRAAGLLEKGADGLRQVLAANQQREVQIEVRGNEETQERFLNPDGQNEQNRQQQQQQQNGRRNEQRSAQDFLQQLRLGLVDVDDGSN